MKKKFEVLKNIIESNRSIYDELNSSHFLVRELMIILGQIFSNRDDLHHFLKDSSSYLKDGNKEKIKLWIGDNNSGKSSIQKLYQYTFCDNRDIFFDENIKMIDSLNYFPIFSLNKLPDMNKFDLKTKMKFSILNFNSIFSNEEKNSLDEKIPLLSVVFAWLLVQYFDVFIIEGLREDYIKF